MKKVILMCGVILAASVGIVSAANEDTNASPISVSTDVGIYSKYVGIGGTVFENHPVEQASVNLGLGPISLGLWNNASLERQAGETSGDEVDYTFVYAGVIPVGNYALNSELGLAYYDLSKVFHGRENNVLAYSWRVSKDCQIQNAKLQPYFRVEADTPDNRSSFSGGTFLTVGTKCEAALNSKIKVTEDVSFTRDDGNYGNNPETILGWKLGFQGTVGKWIISPSFSLSHPFSNENGRNTEMVGGIDFATGF